MNFVKLCFASSEAELAQLNNAYTSLFVMGASSAGLLRERGIQFALVGAFDIVGWYSALFAARSISLPDGLYILNKYAQLYDEFLKARSYAGIWVSTDYQSIKKLIDREVLELSIAHNYPDKVAVVGQAQEIQKLEFLVQKDTLSYEPYDLGLGMHSPGAESWAAALRDYLEKIDIKTAEIPVISPLTGELVTADTDLKEIAKTIFTQPILADKIIDRLQDADELHLAIPAQKIRASLEKLFKDKKIMTMETAAEFAALEPAADSALVKEDNGEQS